MQHLTTTELKRELVIRESVAAFEKALRGNTNVCIDVMWHMEYEGLYGSAEAKVKALLSYADSGGWGVGEFGDEPEAEPTKDRTLGEILGAALEATPGVVATPKEPESIPDWEYYGFPDEESYTPGEGCGVEGCCK
jgi:hypothetical protein